MTYTRDEINKHINSLPPDSKTAIILRQLVWECGTLLDAIKPFYGLVDRPECKITLTWQDGDYVSTYTDVLKPSHFYNAFDAVYRIDADGD